MDESKHESRSQSAKYEIQDESLRRLKLTAVLRGLIEDVCCSEEESLGLFLGRAGELVFLAQAARVVSNLHARKRAEKLFFDIYDNLEHAQLGPDLGNGISGIAWALDCAAGALGMDDWLTSSERNDEALAFIASAAEHQFTHGEFDLISGLCGTGLAALSLGHKDIALNICFQLAKLAIETSDGIYWPTPSHRLQEFRTSIGFAELIDLGLAHGVGGPIVFFAALYHHTGDSVVKSLLRKTTNFLLSRSLPEKAHSYPSFAGQNDAARTAWCYGSPGISIALLASAAMTGDGRVAHSAKQVASIAAAVDFDKSSVVDAGFCHGAFGLAHIFHRLASQEGDEFAPAAERWLAAGISMLKSDGDTVFVESMKEITGEKQFVRDRSYLCGSAGVGLTLLSIIDPKLVCWDVPLLTSPELFQSLT